MPVRAIQLTDIHWTEKDVALISGTHLIFRRWWIATSKAMVAFFVELITILPLTYQACSGAVTLLMHCTLPSTSDKAWFVESFTGIRECFLTESLLIQ